MINFDKKVKLSELENKIPNVSNLAKKTALTAVENKIPDVNNLVNKTDYNTKVTEIENNADIENAQKGLINGNDKNKPDSAKSKLSLASIL